MIGVIDVGGGNRDIFGAGVLDYCMRNGIHFDFCVGVSAGAANMAAYQAHQPGRNFKFYTEYVLRKEYIGFSQFVKNRNYVNLDYGYGKLSAHDGESPLDYETMVKDPAPLIIVATEADTGKPHYFTKEKNIRQDYYGAISASSDLPVLNRPYHFEGADYFDGGLSDPIPFHLAFEAGCDRVLVILTRPKHQMRKMHADDHFVKLLSRHYPEAAKALEKRGELYNSQLKEALELEEQGKVVIAAPQSIEGLNTLSRDIEPLKRLYREGQDVGADVVSQLFGSENVNPQPLVADDMGGF